MMRTRVVRVGVAVFIALVGLQLTACGSTIQPEGAGQAVTDLVSEKTDFTPEDVKCPDGVEAKVGGTFDCTFTGPDGDYVAHMKIEKIEGEQVLFDIKTELAK